MMHEVQNKKLEHKVSNFGNHSRQESKQDHEKDKHSIEL